MIIDCHYIYFVYRIYNLPTANGFSYAVEILSYTNGLVDETGILATISSELQGKIDFIKHFETVTN